MKLACLAATCGADRATGSYWLAIAVVYVASTLAYCASREYDHHRRTVDEHKHARRTALLEEQDAAGPCCRIAEHSNGQAHGPGCRRPPDLDTVLEKACCVEALVYCGAEHAPTCPNTTKRSNAA